jgi:hypothetical protein
VCSAKPLPNFQILKFSKKHFTVQAFQKAKLSDVHDWGDFDGSGDPIKFSIERYFERFVTNADYLRAPQRSYNQFRGLGNSLNSLQQVFPSAVFVEYFYPGFDKNTKAWTGPASGKKEIVCSAKPLPNFQILKFSN